MKIHRRATRQIWVGNVAVGGNAPITVQSMTNTDTRDVSSTIAQARELEAWGCEIIRVAVPDAEAAGTIGKIMAAVNIPLIADIHFNYRLALAAIDAGANGVRINPGNIGGKEKLKEIASLAREKKAVIRVGVNAGSLERHLYAKHGGATAEALVESALSAVKFLEDTGFTNIKVSLKAASVPVTVQAYRLFAAVSDYPLHVGITEAGTLLAGLVKSSVGLGILLGEGIGDTVRVSLTAHPREEVRAGYHILRALGLRQRGVEIISCPTCGRCEVDIIPLAEEAERRLAHISRPLKVAIMGCEVNGPGEAREADVGVAFGRAGALLFRKGSVVGRVGKDVAVDELIKEVESMVC